MGKDSCGRFFLVADMNGDGVVTIRDVGSWMEFVFMLPTKIMIEAVSLSESVSQFLEINCLSGTGWVWAIVSWALWWILFTVIFSTQANR